MIDSKRTLIIDFYSIYLRSLYKLKASGCNLTTTNEINTTGVIGFLGTLKKIISKYPIDRVIICSDDPNQDFCYRKGIDPLYKANRGKKINQGDVNSLLNSLRDVFKFPVVIVPDEEADDIIYSIVNSFSDKKYYILSGDKDLLPCVNKNTNLLLTQVKNGDVIEYNLNKLKQDLGVAKPEDLFHIKAIVGDRSDNIPKIRSRVGIKTALKWFYENNIPINLRHIYENNLCLTKLRNLNISEEVLKSPQEKASTKIKDYFSKLEIKKFKVEDFISVCE